MSPTAEAFITEEYLDHSSYGALYDDDPEPCNKEAVMKFGSWYLPTFYTLVFLLGLAGNMLVVFVLIRYKRLKSMTDIYLLNLAFSDLIFVFALPFWSYYAANGWVFGDGMCKFISWAYEVGFYSGINFIMLMSIDRYLAVVHVVFALKARTVNYGTLASLVVWLVAILASVPRLIFGAAVDEYNQTKCRSDYPKNGLRWKLFTALENNIFGLSIPFLVMVFCYSKIVRTLLRCRNEKKRKAVKMIFAVMLIFFLFWTPYNIVLFLECLIDEGIIQGCFTSKFLDYASQVTQTLALFHCCLNPIIYFFMGQKFKKYVKLMLKNCGLHDTFQSEASGSFHTQSTSDEKPL